MSIKIALAAASICVFGLVGTASAAPDAAAAEATVKAEKCAKCHDVAKDKKGPSFKTTAAKYKGKADAEATLTKFLSTGPDDHATVKDAKAAKNLAGWILAQ